MDRPYILLMYLQRMIYKRPFEYLDNLGLMTLAAFLEDKGYRARVFTGITTDGLNVLEEESTRHPVFAVGLYCDYDNQSAVESVSLLLKQKYGLRVIVGGPQTIHLGEEFLKSSRCDALVRGDGEYALLEILDWMYFGRRLPSMIRGIVYLDEEGRGVVNPERPLIRDLDSLPVPSAAHLLHRTHKYNLSVVSARGCPFRCAFCFEGGNTKALRLRSVENVTSQIRRGLEENPEVKYVWFMDDTFTLNYERTAGFCDALARLREERDFVWFCEAHARVLNKWPQLITMMKDAGLVRMQIGLESGWPPALRIYGKQTSLIEIENTVRLCEEAELPQLPGNFIIGGAHETERTLELTASYAERLLDEAPGIVDISTTFVMPLPNTQIANCPGKFALKLLDTESVTSIEDFPVTETEWLGRNAVSEARYRFVQRISDKLKSLFIERRIPTERIRSHFQLALRYGVTSSWYKYLYVRDPFVQPYFTLLVTTPARMLSQIPSGELEHWYPCRVFDMCKLLEFPNGIPRIGEFQLPPFEHELLRLCGGKIKLRDVIEQMSKRSWNGCSEVSTKERVERLLSDYEDRRWMVFCPP
jgi:anaerobic magnesium-protoporphyrin IX monomethyl ester cyclase